uniref:Uncharacterized protein n=1 Tax=Romanomermis culicivorax TaxID=13658 RepID=A0A915IK63_ROMCU
MKPLEDESDDKLSQFEFRNGQHEISETKYIVTQKFQTFDNTSVLTKRNFSLYRGRSIIDAVDVLHLANSTETAGRSSGEESDEPAVAEIPQTKNFYVLNKNQQFSFATTFDWYIPNTNYY